MVVFKCMAGFTVDGSKDGKTEFNSDCTDMGYFKPDGTCIEASKCGAVPTIAHATATPKKVKGAVQFGCNPGYSTDGEKVVAGGMGKNQLFTLKCVEFNNKYEQFKGECKPYAFVASKESTRMYGDVFEALFVVTCKGKLTTAFGKGKKAPVDATCNKLKSKAAKGDCAKLNADIKKDFETAKKEVKKFKKDEEWYDSKDKPGVGDHAMDYCKSLWKLVEKPNDFLQTGGDSPDNMPGMTDAERAFNARQDAGQEQADSEEKSHPDKQAFEEKAKEQEAAEEKAREQMVTVAMPR